MKKFLFTIGIIGIGNDEEEAWFNALDSFGSYNAPLPDKENIMKLDDEEENDWEQY